MVSTDYDFEGFCFTEEQKNSTIARRGNKGMSLHYCFLGVIFRGGEVGDNTASLNAGGNYPLESEHSCHRKAREIAGAK